MAATDEITVRAGSHLRGFRGIAGESKLRPRIVPRNTTTRYFLRSDDVGRVSEVIVFNPIREKAVFLRGPNGEALCMGPVVVFTTGPNGDHQRWGCSDLNDDELTFRPGADYVPTRPCSECRGAKVIGIDSLANPLGSRCTICEGSGESPTQVTLVFPPDVVAERIYLEPTKTFTFLKD